ncbi:putative myosin heavy chain [Triplophysa rosa]|uniref:Myosin heavy chain n=2 Tax=Triplophysa rosa TaxID=992332 RepID=A0A9W7T311_TRIRA|nr:putative myosin heavy chain [Triplophysa rosa]
MEKKVCVIQTDFHQYRPIIAIHSNPLVHVNPLQSGVEAGMREREELKKAIEQMDRLLSRVRQLEGENSELCREKNDVFIRMRAEQESLQQAEKRCVQMVQSRRELEAQVAGLEERLEEEEGAAAQLASQRQRLEAECCSLCRDLEELENMLTSVEKDKQSSDSTVKKLSEELAQKNELVQKLQKAKEHLVELSQTDLGQF